MGIFSRNKAVNRVASLADGRQVIFESEETEIKVGNTLALVGSNESLKGTIRISNTQTAEVDGNNEVTKINDVKDEEGEDANSKTIKDLTNALEASETALKDLQAKFGEKENDDEDKKKKETEAKNSVDEQAAKNAADSAVIADTIKATNEVLASVKSVMALNKPENKHESVTVTMQSEQDRYNNMLEARNSALRDNKNK
jgi:hypothetical protein